MIQKSQPTSLHQQLCSAIETKRLIQFTYQALRRIAEPHDYGIINGTSQLLVYQVAGKSRSRKLPDWRLIKVAEIAEFRILEERFPGGRAVPSGKHKQWDCLFARVAPAT